MKTGWKVIGHDAERRIAEFKVTDENEDLLSYDEAKQIVLEKLKDQVAPFLRRIEEVERDVFLTASALPPLRAWSSESRGREVIVAAKSKKRAMEIAQESRRSFDNYWSECGGVWWYHVAHEESLWILEKKSNGGEIEDFQRCLTPDEAEVILNEHATHYREGNIEELLIDTDEERIDTGVSPAGTAYRITTTAYRNSNDESRITFRCGIEDGFGVIWHQPFFAERRLPQPELVAVSGWKDEGF